MLLNAEFAAEAFSAEAFSAEAFSAEAFSAEAFSAEAFSAEAFSAEAFSAEAFSAEAFSAEAFSAEAFSAEAFSAEAFSAEAFSAEAFSGGAFSAEAFSAEAFSAEAFSAEAFSEAFSSAQTRSVLAVSAFNGVANEVVIKNTWDNAGYFYIRVRGRDGAFALGAPFHLQVGLLTSVCASIDPILVPSSTTATAGPYKTIILTDMNRLAGSGADKVNLLTKLAAFAARDEVKGMIVDVGADTRVAAANAQADARPECPFAKNLVALAIRGIVQSYRAMNSSLEYAVIVGNDHVIPFFRYPDLALLANENNYIPPVLDDTASQASLRLGYVLSQDAYGSQCDLSLKAGTFPIPDLSVGRVVETASEIAGMLDAYPATTGGVVPTPKSALVTGYDFLEDVARAVTNELKLGIGIGGTMDALIADRDKAPELGWTADQLRPLLLGTRHDLIIPAKRAACGTVSLLAGDYTTHLLASELLAPTVDLKNAIFFSLGCHAGYNIVDRDGIPNVTQAPDWAQAFARKQVTAVFNTGYGYGDTDFISYSELLYKEFSRELRAGTGPVAVGKALVRAKQTYLAATPQMRGIDDKTLLQATLFGLPMLSVDLPAGRGTPPADVSVVPLPLVPAMTHPGDVLGLQSQDISLPSSPTLNSVTLTNPVDHSTVTASYLSGDDGVLVNPGEPVLPLEIKNVTVSGTVLRGVRFLGGTYSDINGVLPLTGAPVTEIRGIHAPFLSEVFYPIQPWSVNYFDALCKGIGGVTRLMVTPAQFRSTTPGSITGILRKFTSMDFRLYYSANTQKYPPDDPNGYVPAQAAAPDIASVSATAENGEIHFRIRVLGDPAAGIQDVWVTYTATTGPWLGLWQSKTNLIQATG